MRKTMAISKRNAEHQEEQKQSSESDDADNLSQGNVNYKDLDKIRSQCLYVNVKKRKRCTRKAGNYDYCFWHRKKGGKNYRRRD